MRAAVLLLLALASLAPDALAIGRGERVRLRGTQRTAVTFQSVVVDFTTSARPRNPFDPAEIAYALVATRPDGTTLAMPAFWYQDFRRSLDAGVERLRPRGRPHWRVRFTPDAPGAWSWRVVRTDGSRRVATKPRTLRVHPSQAPGFLRRSPHDDRHLAFDDGSSYFAVGENLSWYDARGTHAYDQWLAELAAAGGNFARLWMPSWAFGIEWSDTGLGDYTNRLHRAWQLDYVFARAEALGIRLQLALLNHGAFSTEFNSEWDANPYNARNGGPLARPEQFFTNEEARRLFRQRLRYIVARWGASPNLLAWELWNEVDLTDRFDSGAITAWHREMAAELRALDLHDHLVTTSTAYFFNDLTLWLQGGLDVAQVHFYATIAGQPFLPEFFTTVPYLTDYRREQAAIPVLMGELGIAHSPSETVALDPEGIALHDGLWAGVFSNGFGTSMPWWWDSVIHPDWERYGPLFAAVAGFVRGVRFDREGFAVGAAPVGGAPPEVAARALLGASVALVWVRDLAHQWLAPALRDVGGATVTLALGDGAWCGSWRDTWAPAELGAVRVDGGGERTLPVPPFRGGVALRLERCTR